MGGSRGRLVTAQERELALELIDTACRAGARKRAACDILGISVRTSERWAGSDGLHDKRKLVERIPGNKLSPEQRAMVIATVNNDIYRNLPPSKIVPLLADTGVYIASEATFYRILRAEKQLKHRLLTRPVQHHRPKAYGASGPNQVWSWDITYCPSQVKGIYFYLYMIMDIFSRKITGFSVHEQELSIHAANLIHQACLDEQISKEQLVLHSDNGAPMKGASMLATLENLGVTPSFSRPAVSDDNPYSEALFRTAKYHHSFPVVTKFESLLATRTWAIQFVNWYNNEHLHSALKFVTPQQRHTGEDVLIRAKRRLVYEAAKARHPQRWSAQTRNWSLSARVTLNPNDHNDSIDDADSLYSLGKKLKELAKPELLDENE